MLNTITRAELAAILVALRHCQGDRDEIIATDSKCSMDKVVKHIRNPTLTENDCHQPMLQAIVQLLVGRAKADLKTTLMKVKSHTGIKGNEMADQLANTAADHAATDQPVEQYDMDVSHEHIEDFEDKYWPSHKVAECKSNREANTRYQKVRDLKDSLKFVIHRKLRLGQRNQESVYFTARKEVYQHIDPEYSNAFWNVPGITIAMITSILKTKQGNTWNKKLAKQRNMPYKKGQPLATDGRCPLCG